MLTFYFLPSNTFPIVLMVEFVASLATSKSKFRVFKVLKTTRVDERWFLSKVAGRCSDEC